MNYLSRVLCISLILVTSLVTKAQQSKSRPLLFERFSDSLTCSSLEIEKLFTLPAGSAIEAKLSPSFTLHGIIRASVQKYSNLKTVIIDCSDLGGAILSVSARNEEGLTTFVGRILSDKYDDGFELQKDNRGNYLLKKFKVEEVIMD